MRFIMKERFFSFTDTFDVTDESGAAVYKVRGKYFAIGDKLIITDARGNEVARINQRLLSLRKTYDIEAGGRTLATVQKKMFTLLRHRFFIDVPGPDDLEAIGDFFQHEFTFERQGQEVARVGKKFLSLRDAYAIDVAASENPVLIIASAIVIDLVLHEKDD